MEDGILDFWQHHSLNFLQMAFDCDKRERLENPHGYGAATRECGDSVEIFLLLRQDGGLGVSFETDGCLNTMACANAAAHLADGKTIEEARLIDRETLIHFLETLPKEESHCAEMVELALRRAMADLEVRCRTRTQ